MSNILSNLIEQFSKLPGIGPRSAKRIALHLVKQNDDFLSNFSSTFQEFANCRKFCVCGNLISHISQESCNICTNLSRDDSQLCVIEDINDLWAIEDANIYHGLYHVLGGYLSAIDGITPDKLNIPELERKLASGKVTEVIIATNTNSYGQITSSYIADLIRNVNSQIIITRPSNGIPVGSELEFIDGATLSSAIITRRKID